MDHEMMAQTWLATARNMYNGRDASKGPAFRAAVTLYYLGKAEAHALSMPGARYCTPLVEFIRECIDFVMPTVEK